MIYFYRPKYLPTPHEAYVTRGKPKNEILIPNHLFDFIIEKHLEVCLKNVSFAKIL
jgi:hypothetical protein